MWGGTVAVVSIGWAVFALYWVIPHFREGAESDTIARYAWLGGSPGEILRTLLTSPWVLFASHYHRVRRAIFPIQLIWPIAGLPLLAPGVAVVAFLSLALSFASSNVSQPSIYFQYNAPILPILFWAALEGARRLRRSGGSRGWMLAGLLFSLAFANLGDPATVKGVPRPYAIVDGIRPRGNRAAFLEAARQIPPSADLIAGNSLAPHFSARARLYVYNPRKTIPDASWAILDLTDTRHIDSEEEIARGAVRLVTERGFRVAYFRDGILVLRRNEAEDPAARTALDKALVRIGLPPLP